jgi:hypothetical protein
MFEFPVQWKSEARECGARERDAAVLADRIAKVKLGGNRLPLRGVAVCAQETRCPLATVGRPPALRVQFGAGTPEASRPPA